MKLVPWCNNRRIYMTLLVAVLLCPAMLCADNLKTGTDGGDAGNGQGGEIGLGGGGGYSAPLIHLNGFPGGNGGNGASGGNGNNGGAGTVTIRTSTPVTNELAYMFEDMPEAPAGIYLSTAARLGGKHGQGGSSQRGYHGGSAGNGGAYQSLGEFGQKGEDPNSYAGRNEVWIDPLFHITNGCEGLNGGGGGGGPNDGWPVNGYSGGDGNTGRANDGGDGVNGAYGTVIGTHGSTGQAQSVTITGGQDMASGQIGGNGGDAGDGGRGGDAGGGGGGSGEYFWTIGYGAAGGTGGSGGTAGTTGYGAHGTLLVETGGVAVVGGLMWGAHDYDPVLGFYNFYVILHSGTLFVGYGAGGAAGTLEVRSGGTLRVPDESSLIVANLSSEAGLPSVVSTLSLLAGSTTVNNGTLELKNSSHSLNNYGTFTGKGTVKTTLINHGVLSPGNSTGTMVVVDSYFVPGSPTGTMTVTGNYDERGTLQVELDEAANDLVDVSGNVIIGAGAILEVSLLFDPNISPDDTLSFDVIEYSGTLSGTFDDNLASLPGQWNIIAGYDLGGGQKSVRLTREPLPIISIGNPGSGTLIEATRLSSNGTTRLQFSTDLATGIWSNLYDTSGVSSTNWLVDSPDTPRCFYRLNVD